MVSPAESIHLERKATGDRNLHMQKGHHRKSIFIDFLDSPLNSITRQLVQQQSRQPLRLDLQEQRNVPILDWLFLAYQPR